MQASCEWYKVQQGIGHLQNHGLAISYMYNLSQEHTSCKCDTNFDVTNLQQIVRNSWHVLAFAKHSQWKQGCDVKICIAFAFIGSMNLALGSISCFGRGLPTGGGSPSLRLESHARIWKMVIDPYHAAAIFVWFPDWSRIVIMNISEGTSLLKASTSFRFQTVAS